MSNKRTLGRGLHSLIPEVDDNDKKTQGTSRNYSLNNDYNFALKDEVKKLEEQKPGDKIQKISLEKIKARSSQPRKSFDEEALKDLAASIKEYGLLNPIVVSKVDDKYEIIAGERRYRASKIAGLNDIDAIIRDYNNKEIEILSLIENVQREDLKTLEEARAYKKLADDHHMTQEQIAKTMGKSRSYIANTLRLLNLEEVEKKALDDGKISPSQARTLLSISDANQRSLTLNDFINGSTNIRKVEKNTSKKKSTDNNKKEDDENKTYGPDIDQILVEDLEEKFMDEVGSKVAIKKEGKSYKLTIDCYSIDDIEKIYNRLKNENN
ncbi:ParB/RepB/Spo0J family partition protein [Anaerococcus octavius]|uniref:DNA-binding protein n=1 Tax=Anaerococcus octavius TaxID=54007 RepID=A0A2I1MBR1_9FIRM|nr:ParB/RepB/Spo0J family partition protein [Anaerococcus octavius]PKZ17566.1 DNA-binding protein [Anaerococcus octavius]